MNVRLVSAGAANASSVNRLGGRGTIPASLEWLLTVFVGLGRPSVATLGFWMLVAARYRPEDLAGPFTSVLVAVAIGEITSLAVSDRRLGIGRATATLGEKQARAVAVALGVATAVSTVFVAGSALWAPALGPIRSSVILSVLVVVGTTSWATIRLAERLVAGVFGSVEWVWLSRSLLAVGQIALAVILSLAAGREGTGPVVVAWTLPVLASAMVVVVPLVQRFTATGGGSIEVEKASFVSPATGPLAPARLSAGLRTPWLVDAARWVAVVVVALLAIGRLTTTDAAGYLLAWLLVWFGVVVTDQLTAMATGSRIRSDQSDDRLLTRALLVNTGIGAAVAVVIAAAGPALFGALGAEVTDTAAIRWFALFVVAWAIVETVTARLLAELRNNMVVVAGVSMAAAVIVLAVGAVGLFGTAGLVGAWLFVEWLGAVVCVAALTVWWWGARLAGRSADVADRLSGLARSLRAIPERSNLDSQVNEMLDGMYREPPKWERSGSSQIRQTLRVDGHEGRPPLRLELARSRTGTDQLAARRGAIKEINEIPELVDLRPLVPFPIDHGDEPSPYLVESVVSGQRGDALADAQLVRRRVEAVTEVMASLHDQTSLTVDVNEAVLDQWVARPLRRLGDSVRIPDVELARLARVMFDGLNGLSLAGGRIHGSLRLDNVLFDPDGARIKGLVGWEWSEPGPVALDWGVLALSGIMVEESSDLGPIVGALLDEPARLRLHPAFVSAVGDAVPPKVLVLMAWLQYTRPVVLEAGSRGLSRYWEARNVRPVLNRLFNGS